MKLKIYISVLMLSLILNSCVKEAPMWKRTYQIKNNSGFDVTIRAFENYLGEGDFQDFTVLNGTILSGVKVEGTNFDTVDQVDNANVTTTSFSATRFIIVYNSEKRMTHSVDFDDNNNPAFSNPINRNIIRAGNYTNIGNDIYQFTLIQEDYDNAEPCNGDCLDQERMKNLNDALKDASSWLEWRDRIFNVDPNNPTRYNFNELFNNW